MGSSVERRHFGILPSGQPVDEYKLNNRAGAEASVITYGATLRRLTVPDRHGTYDDVVLGFDSLEEYLRRHPFFGATIGRVAGRITGGAFMLDGVQYDLERNDPPNHLHGGSEGFDRRLWTATSFGDTVELSYRSPCGEAGYPGTVDVRVRYSLSEDNELCIDYRGETNRPTPLSMTNHSYFNLAGEGSGSIHQHWVRIDADGYVPTDDDMTLLGRVESVEGAGTDLRTAVRVGEVVPQLFKHHGDNYVISGGRTVTERTIAEVVEPASGRMMEVRTTEPCVQFYTGVFLDGSFRGKSGNRYGPHEAFCLECQGYPDGANVPQIADVILRPGDVYRQTTVYRFSTQKA
jgi:aldose 1-epimerase